MTIIAFYGALFIAIFLGSCGSINIGSELKTEKIQPTVIPTEENVFRDGNGRLINKNGWQIPMPDEKKADGERITEGTTVKGDKIKVIISYYLPKEPFFHDLEIGSAFQEFATVGVIKIESIGELKANNRLFGYTINARQSNGQKPGFGYRLYDADGNGKFETMVVDDSKFPIPDWVL